MGSITEQNVVQAMRLSGDKKLEEASKNTTLVSKLVATLNASIQIAGGGNKAEAALLTAKKLQSVADVGATASGTSSSSAVAIPSLVIGTGLSTISTAQSISKLSGSPGKMVAQGVMGMAEKVVLAGGMAGFNECRSAVASLAITTVSTGLAAGATAGVGAVFAAAAIASDMFAVYGACYADGKDGKDLVFID